MLAGAVIQAARSVLRAAQQQQRFLRVRLGGLGLFARGGRHQHALARAQDRPGVGAQFKARAAPCATVGVVQFLFDQMAQPKLGGGGGAGQPRAQFAARVVKDPLVAARAVQPLAMPSAQHTRMIGLGILTGRPGRKIGVVVKLPGNNRPVDIAIDKLHDDLGAAPGQVMRAPVGAGLCAGHAQPRARAFVAGGVAAGVTVRAMRQSSRQGLVAALPGELHLDAQVAVRGDGGIAGADHHGGQALGGGWARAPRGNQRGGFGLRGEAVAIGAAFHVGGVQHLGGLGPQVVAGFVHHLQHHIAVAAQFIDRLFATTFTAAIAAFRIAFMLRHGKQAAGGQGPRRARARKPDDARFMGAQGTCRALFGGVVIGVAAVSGVVVIFQHRQGFHLHGRAALRGMRGQRAFVPGGARHGVRAHGLRGREMRDAVAGFGGVAAMKTQRRRGVFGARRAHVEDHDAMARAAARRLAVVLLMFKAIRQARFGQDALHELQV
ncbi:hypothetical protein D3C86_588290 [compost metagenome]